MLSTNLTAAIPVAVKGFTWGAAAGWSTFGVLLGAIGLLIRNAGPFVTRMIELVIARGDKVRGEKREDELSDATKISLLNERMTRLTGAFAFLANAVTVAVSGLASDDAHARDQTASQARELVAMAVSTLGNEDPYVNALNRIASIPPVDRSPRT